MFFHNPQFIRYYFMVLRIGIVLFLRISATVFFIAEHS